MPRSNTTDFPLRAKLSAALRGANFTWKTSGVRAACNLWLNLDGGRIHAVVGENGAGKTTLGHIFAGVLRPDSGVLQIGQRQHSLHRRRGGLLQDIGLVRQHCIWPPDFRIREMAFLGRKPRGPRAQSREFSQAAERWGFGDINPEERVGGMDASGLQRAQMAAALMMETRFLVLDEPSSAWEEGRKAEFFALLNLLRSEGRAILLITHRIDDVFRIADVVTALKGGRIAGAWNVGEISREGLTSAMFGGNRLMRPGSKIDSGLPGKTQSGEEESHTLRGPVKPVLEVRNLSFEDSRRQLKKVNFKIFPGEILAITGLRGEGISCLEDAVTGNIESFSGELLMDAKPCRGNLRRKGLRYVPSNKLERGSSLNSTLAENIMALEPAKFSKRGWLSPVRLSRLAEIRGLGWGALGKMDQKLGELSGGNIQRAILEREIGTDARLYVLADPVWGLDELGKERVHARMEEIRNKGAAVLLLASDIDEALGIANRIGVIYGGQLREIRNTEDWKREDLQKASAGFWE